MDEDEDTRTKLKALFIVSGWCANHVMNANEQLERTIKDYMKISFLGIHRNQFFGGGDFSLGQLDRTTLPGVCMWSVRMDGILPFHRLQNFEIRLGMCTILSAHHSRVRIFYFPEKNECDSHRFCIGIGNDAQRILAQLPTYELRSCQV